MIGQRITIEAAEPFERRCCETLDEVTPYAG
jgi:hypothetical protein